MTWRRWSGVILIHCWCATNCDHDSERGTGYGPDMGWDVERVMILTGDVEKAMTLTGYVERAMALTADVKGL